MTQEVGRRLIDGVWTTDVQDESSGGGGGASFPDEWTVGEDGSLVIESGDPDHSDYFKLTPAGKETFATFLRVYNELKLDDCDLVAYDDNGNIHLRIVSSGDGFLRAYKPDHSVYFELDSSTGAVKLDGVQLSGFPVTLSVDESVEFVSADDPTNSVVVANQDGVITVAGQSNGIPAFSMTTAGSVRVSDNAGGLVPVYTFPATPPVIPATPSAQDVTDALITLGLVTQAA